MNLKNNYLDSSVINGVLNDRHGSVGPPSSRSRTKERFFSSFLPNSILLRFLILLIITIFKPAATGLQTRTQELNLFFLYSSRLTPGY